ncbi:hypothetical protein BCL76_101257 [Streptomyces sp. CG 926]|uniref:hypothetical protein n=1 Tax=Streptomyces sp. CG 926 TaxID=1882405 RepID=UPI000D7AE0C8|nr:hypothetical protein [Streptomyces sp. CG 926]PWK74526.1 hypothetical protein BCL76_101257 [Streptomyces sp. CG 926]
MTTDEITWQRADVRPPEPCPCGARPLPLGGPEGGAVVHAEGCPQGGRYGIT